MKHFTVRAKVFFGITQRAGHGRMQKKSLLHGTDIFELDCVKMMNQIHQPYYSEILTYTTNAKSNASYPLMPRESWRCHGFAATDGVANRSPALA